MSEQLTAEHFHPYIGQLFRVRSGRHALKLTEVLSRALLEAERKAGLREPFTLIFAGPPLDVLREGLYTFHVEGGKAFELYVMPVHTPARDRQHYQAVFN